MDLVLKGRGMRITDQVRRTAEHKLAKVSRLAPEVTRLEVELIEERNPRIDGHRRVELTCDTRHRVYRAEGSGRDVDAALDQALQRLERQLSTHRGKLRDRWTGRADRLQSVRTAAGEGGGSRHM